jgi:hypothetical protein
MTGYEEDEATKAKLNTFVPGWREMNERRIICELLALTPSPHTPDATVRTLGDGASDPWDGESGMA